MVAARHIPLDRIGEAEEFANLACFIASDAASYITCVAINIDGGRLAGGLVGTRLSGSGRPPGRCESRAP